MQTIELRDPDSARLFLCQGLWLQRARPVSAVTVRPALEWALEIAAAGQPLPPVGFVADVAHLAFVADWESRSKRDLLPPPGWPAGLLRAYEDHVLGKLYTDSAFSRGCDALRRYQLGRDQSRGLMFLIGQFREQVGCEGVLLAPGVIKSLLEADTREALAAGWQSLEREGPQSVLLELVDSLVRAVRMAATTLNPEDVFELEHGTAVQSFGERIAIRQILQAAAYLEAELPVSRPPARPSSQEVATRLLDADTYPVGGFAALSTRGGVESLLQSQLAYMEKTDRPDLFDAKYLRDELLYYSRDENEFLRRRRTFAFILLPNLIQTRFKDPGLRWQRGVLLLAMLLVAVRKLCDWLSTDALTFVFYISEPLAPERELLESMLREQIANKTVDLIPFTKLVEVERDYSRRARRTLCRGAVVTTEVVRVIPDEALLPTILVSGRRVLLVLDGDSTAEATDEEPMQAWSTALEKLLRKWM